LNICLVRRPVCDENQSTIAYELRSLGGGSSNTISDEATSTSLVNCFVDHDISTLIRHKPVIIPLSKSYITGEISLPEGLPHVCFEISADILPDNQLIPALEQLRLDNTHTLFLSNVHDITHRKAIIDLVDCIKVDITTFSYSELQQQIDVCRQFDVRLIAENVSTQEAFNQCQKIGFYGFVGYFFCMPQKSNHKRVSTNRLSMLRIISELEKPNTDVNKLEKLIETDVIFSYRILRFMNSAHFYLQKPVNSLKRAITLAGIQKVKTWAIILAHSCFDDKPHELMLTSLLRAKMCEILAKTFKVESHAAFIVGLFSTLDALLDKPIEQILEDLPLSQDIKYALIQKELSKDIPLCFLLHAVIAYERANWALLTQLNLNILEIKDAYLESIEWCETMESGLLSAEKSSNIVNFRKKAM